MLYRREHPLDKIQTLMNPEVFSSKGQKGTKRRANLNREKHQIIILDSYVNLETSQFRE